jgi:peptide-methionine (R)-S-oxide reductase/peptide methionine sulfoxide reductase msrA/msrB
MKTAIITTLGLILVLAGAFGLQASGMKSPMGKDDGMAMPQTVQDDRKGMASDAMMKQDGKMMPHDTTKGVRTMIPGDAELRKILTPLQYKVTREEGTEPPFNNAYWNNHEPGIYVDIISGVPLFSSVDKYDSGTGWPSFSRPLDPAVIVNKEDRSFFTVRTEVRAKLSDAHLGHVFDDGPPPTGLRYCMNSAALRFIPKADLAKEGYGEYASLFK